MNVPCFCIGADRVVAGWPSKNGSFAKGSRILHKKISTTKMRVAGLFIFNARYIHLGSTFSFF